MTGADTILAALVASLRALPALVTEMGDANRIVAFTDEYATANNLEDFVIKHKRPGVVVAWNGVQPGGSDGEWWRHRIAMYVQAGDEGKYFPIIAAILNGQINGNRWIYRCPTALTLPPQDLGFERRIKDGATANEIFIGRMTVGDRDP